MRKNGYCCCDCLTTLFVPQLSLRQDSTSVAGFLTGAAKSELLRTVRTPDIMDSRFRCRLLYFSQHTFTLLIIVVLSILLCIWPLYIPGFKPFPCHFFSCLIMRLVIPFPFLLVIYSSLCCHLIHTS
jgi:hypothetical protein